VEFNSGEMRNESTRMKTPLVLILLRLDNGKETYQLIVLVQWFSNFSTHQNKPANLVKQ
jgi:hypothetical protein